MEDISLIRRYTNNNQMIYYRHIPVNMISDTCLHQPELVKPLGIYMRSNICHWLWLARCKNNRIWKRHFSCIQSCIQRCIHTPKVIIDGARLHVKGEILKLYNQTRSDIVKL